MSEPVLRTRGRIPCPEPIAETHGRNTWPEPIAKTHGRSTCSEPMSGTHKNSGTHVGTRVQNTCRNPYDRNPLLEQFTVNAHAYYVHMTLRSCVPIMGSVFAFRPWLPTMGGFGGNQFTHMTDY